MNAEQTLQQAARQLLDTRWRQLLAKHPACLADEEARLRRTNTSLAGSLQACCITNWLLHDLIELIAQSHDRPVAELAPIIRQRINDQSFVNDCVGRLSGPLWQQLVECQVDLLVDVLEHVRQIALARGLWSDAPVPQQMFG